MATTAGVGVENEMTTPPQSLHEMPVNETKEETLAPQVEEQAASTTAEIPEPSITETQSETDTADKQTEPLATTNEEPEPLTDEKNLTTVSESENENDDTLSSSNPAGGHYHVYKRRWLGIICLALMNICISWGWLSFAAISPYVMGVFGQESAAPVNWLSTVIMFSYIAISPVAIWMLKKKDIRWAMITCASFAIVGNWVRYGGIVKANYGAVMFGQILIGFAQPFALSTPAYYTDLWFTSSSRVSANAIASLANPLGGAIAELVGPAMVTSEDPTVFPHQLNMFILATAILTTGCGILCSLCPNKPKFPPCPSSEIAKLGSMESLKSCLTNLRFIAAFAMFSIYVGFFNAFSTFVYQIIGPYGYTSTEAGNVGAILICCGIILAAITSPLVDRFHHYKLLMMTFVPCVAALYIAVIYMCNDAPNVGGPYAVSALLGAISFSLLPVFLEWVQEQTSPCDPMVSSTLLWSGGQLFGAIFIIVMTRLTYPSTEGNPPGNMHRSLIFEAVIACVGILPIYAVAVAKVNKRVLMDV